MKKKPSTLYFEKRYCLLVHSVVLQQRLAVTAFSSNSAEQEIIDRSCSYNVNQIVYINCIDLITEGVTSPDASAELHFTTLGLRKYQKSPIATAKFEMNSEKIVKPQSSLLFSKELEGGNGTLNYKFINLKTKSLTHEQYEANRQQKTEIALEMQKEENNMKMEELMQLLKQKDELIARLETKIQNLIEQGKKRNASNSIERSPSQDNKISLNVKVNTANENMRKENQKLIIMNRDLHERVDELEEQADNQTRGQATLERQVTMLKKQIEKYQKITDMRKSKIKASGPYDGPNFLKNSIDNPMLMEANDLEQPINSNPRIRVASPAKGKESVMHQSEVGSQQDAKANSSDSKVLNRNDSKVLNRSSAPNNNNGKISNNQVQVQRKEEEEVEMRISMQKQDFKWSSMIFDRNEEIDILKNKLEHRVGEVKALEKQLEKAKVALKKKDVELKEMKRLSRKNLLFGQEKAQSHNRGGIELEFEKIQAQHDSEKVRLQHQIQQLDSLNEEKTKEVKRLKNAHEEISSQLRSFQQKYLELKKFTQSSTEEFIEYKQKAQKYDSINLKNKDLQASVKNLDARLFVTSEENVRLTATLNKGTEKWKEREKEWEKLKKMEREFDYQRNQNINLHQSIESYESRYNELKKYCIKIESAYNKFVSSKKKSGKESQLLDDREEKEIQARFVELNKKVNDCEVNYYKQQIDELQEEKNFVGIYFDRKLREEKDKIHEAKELSEEEKRQSTIAKQKQVEKGVAERMEEINSKLSKLSKIFDEVSQRIREDGQESFIQSIPEKMRNLEKKLSMIVERESERMAQRKTLKETIMHFSQQQEVNKMRNSVSGVGSGQGQGQSLGQNQGVMASRVGPTAGSGLHLGAQLQKNKESVNALGLSMMNESRQRLSLLDEAKQRSELSQQRTYEQNRKMNTQLLKQNGEMKMKNQKLTMELQKIERKSQEREKNLEQMFKKSDLEFKLKNQRLTDQVQKLTAEGELLKGKLTDSQQAVDSLEHQLSDLSAQLQKKEELIIQLEERIVRYDERIEQYEEGERRMLDEVGEIKRKSEANQQELFQLMDERNNNFLKIEKTKESEIDKLNKIVRELETNIEAEMYENIQNREKLETLKNTMETGEKETQERLEQLRLTIENKEKQIEEMYLKDYLNSRESEALQHSLIEISNSISDYEAQIAQLNYQLTSALKQNEVYRTQGKEFTNAEANMKEEIKNLNDIVADKTYQLKFFEEMMIKFRGEVQAAEKDMEKLSIESNKLELQNQETLQKYMARMDELISLKEANSLLRIEMERQKGQLTDLEHSNEDLQKRTGELQQEVSQLQEANNFLKKKEQEPNSGKRLTKRANSIISDMPDMSSIGAGGITPIAPFTSLNISKRLENPFEPRFEENRPKLSLSRKISLNTQEKINTTEIAIHIEQPREAVADKNTSSIAIQFDEGEESFRNTTNQLISHTNNNLLQPTIGQEEEQEEQTVNFGRNMPNEQMEESQPLDVSEPDITEYIDRIAELDKELTQSKEEIERLNNELSALQSQNAELHEQLQIASLQPPQLLQRPSALGLSRKTTLGVPGFAASRLEIHTEKQLEGSPEGGQLQASKIHRSHSGSNIQASRDSKPSQGGNYTQLQQKFEAAELEIQYLSDSLNTAKTELEQQVRNNERLIEQAGLCNETIQALEKRLEDSALECEHYKKYQVYEGMFNDQVSHCNELKQEIEDLNMDNFEKDQRVSVLITENGELMERVTAMSSQTAQTSDQRERLLLKIKELNSTIGRLKLQYRKYEEDSQLQIVHLKETIDQYKMKLKTKDDEVNLLGEQYLELQAQINAKEQQLQLKEKAISKQANYSNEAERRCSQLEKEVSQTEQNRQNLMKTIKRLQLQINQKGEDSSNFSKETALTLKKYEIKLQANQEEIHKISIKTNDKEKTINLLKNEIGLYNEECDQLKKANDELTYELDKVEKELKDIMQVYEKQIETFKLQIAAKDDHAAKLNTLIKEKETEYATVFKLSRTVEKERDQLKSELIDVQSGLDKLKQGNAREYTDVYTKLQLKINDYQKLKLTLDQLREDLAKNEQTHSLQIQKYENRLKGYKDKLEQYELTIEELQTEFKSLQDRPSSQTHQEIVFQNGVLRNRIEQLEEQLHRADNKGKVEQIYAQFRKYKANKEREIQDLQAEMEKYGGKINELEESVFYLKKENERLNSQNDQMSESREEMLMECEDLRESLQDVEKELVFYKNRKMLDMQKLLNDTNV